MLGAETKGISKRQEGLQEDWRNWNSCWTISGSFVNDKVSFSI